MRWGQRPEAGRLKGAQKAGSPCAVILDNLMLSERSQTQKDTWTRSFQRLEQRDAGDSTSVAKTSEEPSVAGQVLCASAELPLPWMWDIDSQKPPKGRWSTPPFDPRFPNQNQTRNCYQNFLDYHRCVKNMNRRGKSTQPCEYYFRVFHSLCPMSWVQRWTEQIKAGTFAGKI
uniref:Cytochrome c oxidase subunit 6B2 n=1 Tax=Equus caballus TaxID=9796 RepID=A0A9L0RAG1_HORSE